MAPVDSARQISFNAPLNDVLIVNAAPGSARKQRENRELETFLLADEESIEIWLNERHYWIQHVK